MKVLHVIFGISRSSGGPSRSSQGLVAAECRAGVDAWIYSFDDAEPWIDGVRRFCPLGAELSVENLRSFDVVHIHGLWDLRLHKIAVMCRKGGIPYVIAPRGMLDPWALSVKKWKKRIALALYQYRDLCNAAAIHATAQVEAEHVRAVRIDRPLVVSPNGVVLPSEMPPKKRASEARTAIFMSRLHPGKGLLKLADSWSRVRPAGWKMKVVGPDTYGHKAEVVSRLSELGVADDWEFVDMLNDDEKWMAYRAADLLIHPSVSENFCITIAEGLAAELPVITTKGTPWHELEGYFETSNSKLQTPNSKLKCGWWIDLPAEGLDSSAWDALDLALSEATSLSDDERSEMGARGKKLVEEKYTWDAVCNAMIDGYKEILNG